MPAMIDRNDAERAAEDILRRERRRTQERHWWATGTPWMLRCEELLELDLDEQRRVVALAEDEARQRYSMAYLTILLSLSIGGGLLILATGGPELDWRLLTLVVSVVCALVGHAIWLVRPLVRKTAAEHAARRMGAALDDAGG